MNPVSGVSSSPEAGPSGPAEGGLSAWILGRMPRWERALTGLAGLLLLPVMFVPILPIWRIHLVAPQYREGLEMLIFADTLRGDLKNINILNHYIGMQSIDPSTFPEFGYMPWVLTLFGVVALLAAIVGRRWLAILGWLGFAVFGTVMMMHFAAWMKEFGTNLDPKAALDFGEFTPQLLGTAHRGNFTVASYPHWGGLSLLVAGLLGPVLVVAEWIVRRRGRVALLVPLLVFAAGSAGADEFTSYARPPAVSPLQAAVEAAAAGDTVRLPAGVHFGQLVIDRPLVVVGPRDAVLDGDSTGTVVIIRAPGVTLRGFTVRNSGYELLLDDAGILVDEADHATLEDLVLEDTNHGVYVRNGIRPRILDCSFTGRRGRVHEENHGNGIHFWHVLEGEIRGNEVRGHRDGIYLSFAEAAMVTDNTIHGQDRFGLHSMYSQRNELTDNVFTRNTAGSALMFSNRMLMAGNLFVHNRGHRTYGLLLRDCSDSEFRHNRLIDNTIALFLDGSNRNRFEENLFAENGWGVIAYSSSEENEFTRNDFLNNDYPVSLDMKRTRNRMSADGEGNYWSDARPYDLDGDGLGDAPHGPVSLFSFVSKQFPDLTVFAASPAVNALDAAQRSLPALQPTEMVDLHPLLQPVPLPPYAGPPVPGANTTGGSRVAVGAAGGGLLLAGLLALGRMR